jgi:hypothetical protein
MNELEQRVLLDKMDRIISEINLINFEISCSWFMRAKNEFYKSQLSFENLAKLERTLTLFNEKIDKLLNKGNSHETV